MPTDQFRRDIEASVERWSSLQSRRSQVVTFSPGAIDFLVQMIENIKQDPSSFWTEEINYDTAQEFALSLIPNILNELLNSYRFRGNLNQPELRITSWEIWHSLSNILSNWCFIPKDV